MEHQKVIQLICDSVHAVIDSVFDEVSENNHIRKYVKLFVIEAYENDDSYDPYLIAKRAIKKAKKEAMEEFDQAIDLVKGEIKSLSTSKS